MHSRGESDGKRPGAGAGDIAANQMATALLSSPESGTRNSQFAMVIEFVTLYFLFGDKDCLPELYP
jgi:hypothetical protein